uniref:hypothetical protein n=1 Tax=Nonomuraea candida TaxID=359159 RepID=UPI0005B89430
MAHIKRLLTALLVFMTAVIAATLTVAPAAQAASAPGGTITRSEVIWRAQYWVDHQPGPYNQGGFSPGPNGTGPDYRRDCSGYVSMAWHLDANKATGTLEQVSHDIPRGDLKPGDILNYPGTHTFMFHRWLDGNGNFEYYTFGATPVRHERANINNAVLDGHPNGRYRAMRYDRIIDDTAPAKPRDRSVSDVTGDGFADLLAYRADGQLLQYDNNILIND